jgi:hypothetical protein
MATRRTDTVFVLLNVVMWAAMTAILVIVPDTLVRWVPMEVARVVGWAVASGFWVVILQPQWRQRVGPFVLFFLQLVLWVSAALVAIWISESARPF